LPCIKSITLKQFIGHDINKGEISAQSIEINKFSLYASRREEKKNKKEAENEEGNQNLSHGFCFLFSLALPDYIKRAFFK
jgi:hypothetical protein